MLRFFHARPGRRAHRCQPRVKKQSFQHVKEQSGTPPVSPTGRRDSNPPFAAVPKRIPFVPSHTVARQPTHDNPVIPIRHSRSRPAPSPDVPRPSASGGKPSGFAFHCQKPWPLLSGLSAADLQGRSAEPPEKSLSFHRGRCRSLRFWRLKPAKTYSRAIVSSHLPSSFPRPTLPPTFQLERQCHHPTHPGHPELMVCPQATAEKTTNTINRK